MSGRYTGMRVGDASTRDGKIITEVPRQTSKALHERPATIAEPQRVEDGPSPFARILQGLGREVDRGEKAFSHISAGGGKDLGNLELLSLQAGVYRYSEAVDLTAKLVDRAASGVKTVLQGQ